MSDEEKKALKEVNHFNKLTRYWQEEEYEEKEIAGYIATVLNLIEKQAKEIEELKEKRQELINVSCKFSIDATDSLWKDKIKAKIEELEKELEDIELKNINKDEINKTTFYFIQKLKHKIEVLQSLLEKE